MNGREGILLVVTALLCLGLTDGSSPAQPPGGHEPFRPPDPNVWEHLEGEERNQAMERELDRAFPARAQMRKQMEAMQQWTQEQNQRNLSRQKEESQRYMLGATEAQWRVIGPRLQVLTDLLTQTSARIPLVPGLGGGSAGSGMASSRQSTCQWRWFRPAEEKGAEALLPTEKTCEELLDLLYRENTPLDRIWEKVELLRKQKQEAAAQIPAARQELRRVVDLRQEAVLTAQGWLQ